MPAVDPWFRCSVGIHLYSPKDSDRYKVANCARAQPVFYRFGRLTHGKVISVSVLTRPLHRGQSVVGFPACGDTPRESVASFALLAGAGIGRGLSRRDDGWNPACAGMCSVIAGCWGVSMVVSGRSGLRFLGVFVFMYWPVIAGVTVSVGVIGGMLLGSESPPVDAPSSWSDVIRSGLPQPAGAGCFALRW